MKHFEIELTHTERQLLVTLLANHMEEGSYYGNKEKHHKLTDNLLEKLI